MEKFKKTVIVAASLVAILSASAYLFAREGRFSIFDGSGRRSENENVAPEERGKNSPEEWMTYRNEEYGFEIKYPGRFSMGKYFKAENVAADSQCNNRVTDSFGIFLNKDSNSPSYNFSIYSNPLRLPPKDFFFCRGKEVQGDDFKESNMERIDLSNVGEKKQEAAFISDGLAVTVMISANGNIYEIRQKSEENDVARRTELDQIIATAKFFDIKTDSQTEKTYNFCATEAKSGNGAGILAFSVPIKAGAGAKEFFIGCVSAIDGNQKEWLSYEPVALYHVVENGEGEYNVVWRGSTGKGSGVPQGGDGNNLDWIYTGKPSSAGDLDNNGSEEIFFSGKGSCAKNCSQWCLYLPEEKNLLCATSFTRSEGNGEVAIEGMDCITDSNAENCEGECHVLLRTLCFSAVAKEPRYKIFKDYLEKNIAPGI